MLLTEANRIMEIAVLKTVQRIVMHEDFDWSLGWEQMGGIADPLSDRALPCLIGRLVACRRSRFRSDESGHGGGFNRF